MKKIWIALLSITLMQCANNTQKEEANTSGFNNIKVEEVAALQEKEPIIFLDVRTAEEVEQGVIPNAIHIDVTEPHFEQDIQALDKAHYFVVYCRSGKRSQKASEIMVKNDFEFIHNLEGGIMAWENAGLELER